MKQPKAGSHVKDGSIEAMEAENPHRMTPIKKIQTKVTYKNIWKYFLQQSATRPLQRKPQDTKYQE